MAKKRRNLVDDRKYHYTYRITNIKEGMYYYGVHSCDCLPEEEIGITYFSSSKRDGFIEHQKEKPGEYKYKVLKLFNTRVEAVEHEIFLHKKFNVKLHEKFYNESNQTSTNFDTTGKANFITEDGTIEFISIEEAKLRGLKGYSDGAKHTVEVRSKMSELRKGKKHSEETKEKIGKANKGRKLSDETKEKMRKPKSEKGRANIKEGAKNRKPRSDIGTTHYLKTKIFKTIEIYDQNNNNKIFECKTEFKKFCKLNKLPFTAFLNSLNNNCKLYLDLTHKATITRLINKDYYKYMGCYATYQLT